MSDAAGFSASMGNFKGVMLCNRPAQVSGSMQSAKSHASGPGSSSDSAHGSGSGLGKGALPHSHASEMNTKPHGPDRTGADRPAFVGGVVPPVPIGLRPLRKVFPKSANAKSVRDSVTWRHKQWLNQFSAQRADAMQRLHADLLDEASKRARVAEKGAAQRAAIRSVDNSVVGTPSAPTYNALEEERRRLQDSIARAQASANRTTTNAAGTLNIMTVHESAAAPPQPQAAAAAAPEARPASPRKPKKSVAAVAAATAATAASSKPVWARTAKENDDVEDAEMDGLVNFATSLDFDNYMKDTEVREAVRAMQNRVVQLEKTEAQKTAREAAERERAARAEQDSKLRELNMKLGGPNGSAAAEDDEWEEYEADDDTPATAADGTASTAAAAAPRKVIKRRRRRKPAAAAATATDSNATAGAGAATADAPHYTDAGLLHGSTTGQLTDRVLQSSHAIRGIHSAASVRAMIDKEQAKQLAAGAGGAANGSGTARFGNTLYDPNSAIPASTLPPVPHSPTNINPRTTTLAPPPPPGAAHALAIQPPVVKVNHQPSLVRPENGLNPSLLPFLRRHPVV